VPLAGNGAILRRATEPPRPSASRVVATRSFAEVFRGNEKILARVKSAREATRSRKQSWYAIC